MVRCKNDRRHGGECPRLESCHGTMVRGGGGDLDAHCRNHILVSSSRSFGRAGYGRELGNRRQEWNDRTEFYSGFYGTCASRPPNPSPRPSLPPNPTSTSTS